MRSVSIVTKQSNKDNLLSDMSTYVKWIFESTALMYQKNLAFSFELSTTNVSLTYLQQDCSPEYKYVDKAKYSNCSIYKIETIGETGEPNGQP